MASFDNKRCKRNQLVGVAKHMSAKRSLIELYTKCPIPIFLLYYFGCSQFTLQQTWIIFKDKEQHDKLKNFAHIKKLTLSPPDPLHSPLGTMILRDELLNFSTTSNPNNPKIPR
jgi:hypothetical protein